MDKWKYNETEILRRVEIKENSKEMKNSFLEQIEALRK
mgnify:CR=1 FL=1